MSSQNEFSPQVEELTRLGLIYLQTKHMSLAQHTLRTARLCCKLKLKGDGGADFYRFSAWVRMKFNDVNTGHDIPVKPEPSRVAQIIINPDFTH